LSLALKEMWEFYRQDHGFFQRFLGLIETGNVFPFDVWLVGEDGTL